MVLRGCVAETGWAGVGMLRLRFEARCARRKGCAQHDKVVREPNCTATRIQARFENAGLRLYNSGDGPSARLSIQL